jgi:hypothetical protein
MGAREVKDPATDSWDIRGAHVVAPVSSQLIQHFFRTTKFSSVLMTVPVHYTIQARINLFVGSNNGSNDQSSFGKRNILVWVTKTLVILMLSFEEGQDQTRYPLFSSEE